ncbi:MAG: pro-sigmaK processing inhibitor BofA family protein [Clostridia bacterium]|nr:pro-sigmaK processing inhibitor BofA family protein [Clostridia bacterium]
MPIPWALVACFFLGLLLIALVGRLLIIPRRFFWRLMANGVLGAVFLTIMNFLSPLTHLTVPVNPFSALSVGFLGLPGAVMLIVLRALL